jgi:hypothetical protein
MNKRDLAMAFIRRFCSGDIDGVASLLAEDLQFSGPFQHFDSRAAYVDTLRNDPPEACGYRVLSLTENEDSVAVFYDYVKSKTTLTIAQLFRFKGQEISNILLVFDGREFP